MTGAGLGLLSRVAARTLRAHVQAAIDERETVPGVSVCVRTFGSVVHLHPHLHVLVTDGAFRRDGTLVPLPVPEPAVLEESWRRSLLAEFVRRGWLEEEAATGRLGWPHSGFGAYIGPRIEEREGLLQVACYSARAPVAESRLRYGAERAAVELTADRNDGPCAGVNRMTALEFLAWWVDHVPEHYEVRMRHAGAYATRRRVWWRRCGIVLARARGAARSGGAGGELAGAAGATTAVGGAVAAGVLGRRRGVRGPTCGGVPRGGDHAHPRASRAARGGRPGRTVGGPGGGSGLTGGSVVGGRGASRRGGAGERAWARLAVGRERAASAGTRASFLERRERPLQGGAAAPPIVAAPRPA